MTTDSASASTLLAVLRRPGTLLLCVLLADTYAYFISNAGDSPVGLLVYLLQMFLLYRIWRGANLVPWLLLLVISGYEAFCVRQVLDAGVAADHRSWVTAHVVAIATTVFVLISPSVRGRLAPVRGSDPRRVA
ncbi:hypothetical protein [Cryptosporangium minutisporangium]|uniref:Rod shape-determining protein MreD n=1 Tax=Cryptosporangium minutisporangium TaxID=113569 RepID=A0ABP6SW61_9ACTN